MADTNDTVNHPAHYTQFDIEVISLTRLLPFSAGNCVKYIVRSPFKKAFAEDIRKALWYADDLLKYPSCMHMTTANREHIKMMAEYFRDAVQEYQVSGAQELAQLLYAVVLFSVYYEGSNESMFSASVHQSRRASCGREIMHLVEALKQKGYK